MAQYRANATNSRNFNLTKHNQNIGELIYEKWYSFNAQVMMENGAKYHLAPKGIWDSKIELKDENNCVYLEFKMGWSGIVINTFFNDKKETFLLKLRGLLSNKFVLISANKEELLVAETDFKWNKLNFDMNFETTPQFDNISNQDLFLVTVLHCINYYMTMFAAAT